MRDEPSRNEMDDDVAVRALLGSERQPPHLREPLEMPRLDLGRDDRRRAAFPFPVERPFHLVDCVRDRQPAQLLHVLTARVENAIDPLQGDVAVLAHQHALGALVVGWREVCPAEERAMAPADVVDLGLSESRMGRSSRLSRLRVAPLGSKHGQ